MPKLNSFFFEYFLTLEKISRVEQLILGRNNKKKGCYFSRMSGSGSVCYGLFNGESSAKNALNEIKARYPKFWFSIAKTV